MCTHLQTNEQIDLHKYMPAPPPLHPRTHAHTHTHMWTIFPSNNYPFCFHEHLLVTAKNVDSLRGISQHTQEDVSSTIIPTIHGTSYVHSIHESTCTVMCLITKLNLSTTDRVYNSGPIILYYNTYHCVTITYSIQYSNMLYRFVA